MVVMVEMVGMVGMVVMVGVVEMIGVVGGSIDGKGLWVMLGAMG